MSKAADDFDKIQNNDKWLPKDQYIAKLKAEGKYNPKEYFKSKEEVPYDSPEGKVIAAENEKLLLSEKLNKLQREHDTLVSKSTNLLSLISEQKVKIKELQSTVNNLKNTDCNSELERVKKELYNSSNEIRRLSGINEDLEHRIHQLKKAENQASSDKELFVKFVETLCKEHNLDNELKAYNDLIYTYNYKYKTNIYSDCTDGSFEVTQEEAVQKMNELVKKYPILTDTHLKLRKGDLY